MNANRAIRMATYVTVAAVAVFAGVISFEHWHHLALTHGQTETDSALLPGAIDGLVMSASLTALYASRNRIKVPILARTMLFFSVSATVAGNLVYGIEYGWLSAILSALPAVSFIGSVELLVWLVRIASDSSAKSVTLAKSEKWEASSIENSHVRRWARANGYDISDRGRILADVISAYRAANGSSNPTVTEMTLPNDFMSPEVSPR